MNSRNTFTAVKLKEALGNKAYALLITTGLGVQALCAAHFAWWYYASKPGPSGGISQASPILQFLAAVFIAVAWWFLSNVDSATTNSATAMKRAVYAFCAVSLLNVLIETVNGWKAFLDPPTISWASTFFVGTLLQCAGFVVWALLVRRIQSNEN